MELSLCHRNACPFTLARFVLLAFRFANADSPSPESCTINTIFENLNYMRNSGITMRTFAERDMRNWRPDMELADVMYGNCTVNVGGRYWIVHVDFPDNRSFHDGSHPATFLGDFVGSERAMGLCAPASCSVIRVRDVMIPLFWFMRLQSSVDGITFDEAIYVNKKLFEWEPGRELIWLRKEIPLMRNMMEVRAQELASWHELDVSWAVLGFPGTGTTTLMRRLHSHPEIEALWEPQQAAVMEEHFFFYGRTSHLPPREEVDAFNAHRTKEGTARSRGVKRTSYVLSDASLYRLARVPGLLAIVVIQDPVARAERQYLQLVGRWLARDPSFEIPPLDVCIDQYCGYNSLDDRVPGSLSQGAPPPDGQKGWLLDPMAFRMSRRVKRVIGVLGRKRLLLVDTSELDSGRRFFDALTDRLGVARFQSVPDTRANLNMWTPQATGEIRRKVVEAVGKERHEAGLRILRVLLAIERAELGKMLLARPWAAGLDGLPPWTRLGSMAVPRT